MPATNLYFNNFSNIGEQNLIEDLIIESIKIYGIECYYMPRTLVAEDSIFGEDPLSTFQQAYNIEMYIKSVEGFEGEGDFLSKFNIEIRDEITFVVSRRRFSEEISLEQSTPVDADQGEGRPMEGDLIFFPLNGKIFEVKFVEHESVFYQLGELQTYELRCELFEYSHEDIEVGIDSIDAITVARSGDAMLYGILIEDYSPSAKGYVEMSADEHTVANVVITDTGLYDLPPTVIFSPPPPSIPATAISYLTNELTGTIGIQLSDEGRGYVDIPSITIDPPPNSRRTKFGSGSLEIDEGDIASAEDLSHNGWVEMWYYSFGLPQQANSTYSEYHTLFITGQEEFLNTENISYERRFGIDQDGDLVMHNMLGNTNLVKLVSNTGIVSKIQNDIWNHIKIAYRGADSGVSERTMEARINGILVYQNSSNTHGGLIGGAYRIGGQAAWNLANNNFVAANGVIDEYYANGDDPFFVGNIERIRSAPYTGREEGTLILRNFNPIQAEAEIVLSKGKVANIVLTNSGYRYKSPPQIRITNPPTATAANGVPRLFVGGGVDSIRIVSPGSGYVTPPSVTFELEVSELPFYLQTEEGDFLVQEEYVIENIDAAAKNVVFQEEAEGKGEETDFIDFSEFNPFSEKGNW